LPYHSSLAYAKLFDMKSFFSRRWWIFPIAVIVLFGIWRWQARNDGNGESFRTAAVDRGDIRVAVSATGSLSALSTVEVGTQVSGLVESVAVDFNDSVRKGQVIARIDPANVRARVTQAAAALASAQASLAQAQANLKQSEADFARKRDLVQRQLVARSEFELASAALDQARAQLASAQASIRQQQAQLDSARLDLGHTDILSPVDGVILARSVEPGQTVAASFQTPVLFKIAEDLRKMQIVLAVDEADIGQVKVGQKASFTVDAFPDRRFEGMVQQVRLAASNTANVITYPVVVSVDNGDLSLLPGMTVNAEIEVSRREGVLRIANAALRFKPADDGGGAAAAMRGSGGLAAELPRIAGGLKLTAAQQGAFDAANAAMRERIAARQATPGNGQSSSIVVFGRSPGGGPAPGGDRGGNDGAMRQRLLERFNQQFAAFRSTLAAEQQEQWDAGIAALVSAKRAPVYKLVEGKPQPVIVRIGASDGSHSEISGDVREGDALIVGSGRVAQ
jgi:HlyD family secretion protein